MDTPTDPLLRLSSKLERVEERLAALEQPKKHSFQNTDRLPAPELIVIERRLQILESIFLDPPHVDPGWWNRVGADGKSPK